MRYYRNYGAKNINLAPIDDLVKVLPTQEQTGKIVTFDSPFAGLPLKSCKIDIPVTQEGTGDPSPDNVRNFVGVDSLDFSATGKNLWGGKAMLYSFIKANIRNATVDEVNNTIEFSAYLVSELSIMAMRQFKQNTQYTLLLTIEKSNNSQSPNLKILYSDGTEDYFFLPTKQAGLKQFFAIKTNPNKTFVGFIGNNQSERTKIYCDECCVLEGDKTTDDFIPFGNNKLFSFGQTIYAGELDVLTGIFTATHGVVDMGSLLWNYSNAYGNNLFYTNSVSDMAEIAMLASSQYKYAGVITSSGEFSSIVDETIVKWRGASRVYLVDSNYTNVSSFTQMLIENNAQLLYELETPIVINLGGMNIETLQGENNLFASTGEMTVQYFKK